MTMPILATKLYIPPVRAKGVLRPRLLERLNEGLERKLTLISASAGFGKTTLVSDWVAGSKRAVAWLSLDEGDKDATRFLMYLTAALQTIAPKIGAGVLDALQSPQPPSSEALLAELLNEISSLPEHFTLVLDDYHIVDSKTVDKALAFLLEHLPPQMHLLIATREDPALPLARLRAKGQLTELRAADLRFTPAEAASFLNQVMDLKLAAEDISALESRTEGWISGLQLAAISMQGHDDISGFIQTFTGSHHFVLDYLMEEVLQQQPESVQAFLLRTSILERMCGPLCDAVLLSPRATGQETLEYLEHANLFIVALDNERRWYRYHHLFADLLRQRLQESMAASGGNEAGGVAGYHIRASQWFEEHGLELEAFQHAAAANDVERAERLIQGDDVARHFRGAITPILDWLGSLPTSVLDARPWLWWRYASLLLVSGQTTGVEEMLRAAEAGIDQQSAAPDDRTRNLIGRIATARAVLALTHYQAEVMITQSRRALETLDAGNLPLRANVNWTLGIAYIFKGERAAARRALGEARSLSQAAGDVFTSILALSGLGLVQELENELVAAAETYRRVLQLYGDHPLPSASDTYLGLAHIAYEWNDLEAAEQHGQQSLYFARQFDSVIDRYIISEVFLARLQLARGDVSGAAAMLAKAEQTVREQHFVLRMPEVAAAQVLVLLAQGKLDAAAQLAEQHKLPLLQARIQLARGEPSAALALLDAFRRQVEAKGWADERLKAMVLQALALYTQGEKDKAVQSLGEALALAEPGGFIRLFVDEGEKMRLLIVDFRFSIEKQPREREPQLVDYVDKLMAAFGQPATVTQSETSNQKSKIQNRKSKIDTLSPRELEILKLIAQGLSNRQISERLFLALSTVKGHSRIIFDKLQVQRRTEAVARARELGLL